MGLLNYAGKSGEVFPACFFYRLFFKLMRLPKKSMIKEALQKSFQKKPHRKLLLFVNVVQTPW